MDLRHLRYFLHVAEEMHFGRAAKRLGISQPPLSQQIKSLETELGVDLFDRTSRKVSLTEAGLLFLPEARKTVEQAEKAFETARRARRGEVGRLAIAFTTSAPFVDRVANALYGFRQDYPDVELTLAEMGRDEQIDLVERGMLDLGIVRDFNPPDLPDTLTRLCLLEEDILLAMREDHPLALSGEPVLLADLAGHPFVLYDAQRGAGFTDNFDMLCAAAGFTPIISQEASGLATLLGLVSAGFGVTILSRSLTRLHPEALVYRSLVGAGLTSRLWLVHRRHPSPTAAAFIQCFTAQSASGPQ